MNKSSGKGHKVDFLVIPIFTKHMPDNQDGENIPTLSAVMDTLRSALPALHSKYKVRQVGIVGSYARNEQKAGSDIDLMVDLYEPIGWDVVELKEYLESLLHVPVDLVLEVINPHQVLRKGPFLSGIIDLAMHDHLAPQKMPLYPRCRKSTPR